jgi:PAS domain S-box-containing protein
MADGKTEVMARQLDAAQAIMHVGSWEWDITSGDVMWSDELYRIYGLEPQSRAITLDVFLAALHPDDRARIRGEIEHAIRKGGRFAYRERVVRPDGSVRIVDTIGEVVADASGQPTSLLGTCRDVTEETYATRLLAGGRQALEQLASGAPLDQVLETIVLTIEDTMPNVITSILLLDDDKLRHGAAPHLPAAYVHAIDGSRIGAKAGSCGTAAFRGEAVFVDDIANDPLWDDYRQYALPYGLRACWSIPIRAREGRILGTFAIYHHKVRHPEPQARELIERAAHLAGIAIERRQLDDQLRALTDRLEAVREDERTRIAREIHDELGQALTALKLDIAWVAHRTRTLPEVTARLDDMAHMTDQILGSVRRISSSLRPGILDHIGLRAAIEWQADDFAKRTGVACAVRADVGDLQLERELATTVFRIFQEALTNVTRHANATGVDVVLRLDHGHLRLEVADDGIGVPEIAPRTSSLGLLGMRERARRCGGDCTIRRRDPRGTIVTLSVPLRFPRASEEEIA